MLSTFRSDFETIFMLVPRADERNFIILEIIGFRGSFHFLVIFDIDVTGACNHRIGGDYRIRPNFPLM